jgi:hypothetical protein
VRTPQGPPRRPPTELSDADTTIPRPAPTDPLGRIAAATVDRQVAAYNAHDLDGFLATYADSVAVQHLGDTVVAKGKPALRQSTSEWFTRAPKARTQVLGRVVMGPFVVDHERITGTPEGQPMEVVGIFEVRDSLIRRVWFIPPAPRTD